MEGAHFQGVPGNYQQEWQVQLKWAHGSLPDHGHGDRYDRMALVPSLSLSTVSPAGAHQVLAICLVDGVLMYTKKSGHST